MRKYFLLPYNEKHVNQTGEVNYQSITVFSKVMYDSQKCIDYAHINLDIDNTNLVGKEILGFIKNYQ